MCTRKRTRSGLPARSVGCICPKTLLPMALSFMYSRVSLGLIQCVLIIMTEIQRIDG